MTKEKEKETWEIPDFDKYEINKLDDKFLIKEKPKPKNYVVACTCINIALLALNVCVFLSTKILVTTIIQVVK
nr:MAG TPA: hypothetical protein [Caudoviricetes sp.]